MMATALPPVGVGALVALLVGAALAAIARAASPADSHRSRGQRPSSRGRTSGDVSVERVVAGAVAGFAVLLATGWLLLALFVGALVAMWGRLLHDRRADEERARIEGIAKWLEDLRDTLRGSSVGAEEALELVAARPPDAIAVHLHRYVHRRRQGFRTEDALSDFAEDLDHPSSDAAVAAIRLVVGGSAGAGRLYGTVSALAETTRAEVAARERIDRTRAIYQDSMKRLVIIGALLVAYLKFAGGGLLDPYDSPTGQVVLLLPLGMWLGCVLWLRSLCTYEVAPRPARDSREAGAR